LFCSTAVRQDDRVDETVPVQAVPPPVCGLVAENDQAELHPQFVSEFAETNEQYERCWFFFDVGGKLRRPLSIRVEYQDVGPTYHITVFDRPIPRLV